MDKYEEKILKYLKNKPQGWLCKIKNLSNNPKRFIQAFKNLKDQDHISDFFLKKPLDVIDNTIYRQGPMPEVEDKEPSTKEICKMCHWSSGCENCCKECNEKCNSHQYCQIGVKGQADRLASWKSIMNKNSN